MQFQHTQFCAFCSVHVHIQVQCRGYHVHFANCTLATKLHAAILCLYVCQEIQARVSLKRRLVSLTSAIKVELIIISLVGSRHELEVTPICFR